MNKKRLVALLAAAVMILGTVPVYAEETGSGTLVETATDDALNITGDATVNDVAKADKYVVTLPTAEAFDFYVDPYGLVGAATGASVDIVPNATGESAIVVKEDALAVIKNQSNVDVVVDVTIQIEATGGTLNLVTDQADVATGTATNMFIGLVPGTKEATGAATYVATGEAIAIDADGTTASFLLEAATYEVYVKDDNSLGYRISQESDNLDAVAFKLGGSVNRAADWSVFAEGNGSISFDVVFDIAKATTEVRATNTDIYGLVSGTAVVGYTPVAGTTNNSAETAYVETTNATYWYVWSDEGKTTPFDSTAVATVNGKEVAWTSRSACASSLKIANIAAALDMGTTLTAGDYEVVITLEDNTVYKATVTVN